MAITRRLFLASGAALTALAADQLIHPQRSFGKDKVVNLYTARHYEADSKVYEAFFAKTGIKVNLIESPAEKLIERIKSEGANSPADVVMTVDAGNLVRAKDADILQKLDDKSLNAAIDSRYRDPSGFWYGFTKRARVIVYNKDLVKDPSIVKTYEDLADPRLKQEGRKGILVRSSSNIYNQSLVGSLLAAYDEAKTEEWVKGFVSNLARKPEGNDTAQLKAVAAGQGEFAICNTYYLVRLAKSKKSEDRDIAAKLGVIFPNQAGEGKLGRGAHFNISGGGLAKNAPNRDHAIEFLKYLASAEAQSIFASSNNEYPMIKDVAIDSVLAGYGSNVKEDAIDAVTFARNNQKALKIADRAGWK
jgi:iron(III) transport system substrate-binding protein